jgi:hypothetical protein
VKVEQDTCCFYQYVGEGAGDYQVTFTRIGESKGNYSYIYSETWDKYVHVYTGIGAYVDKVEVTPEVGSRIVHMNAAARITDWLEISSEAAQSDGDRTDSDGRWVKRSDRAYAIGVRGGGELPPVGDKQPGALTFAINRRSVGEDYVGMDRLREPTYLETWGVDPGDGFEQTDEIDLAYAYGEAIKATAALGLMDTDLGRSRRSQVHLDMGDDRLGFSAHSERADVDDGDLRRGIRNNSLGLRLPIAFMRLSLGRDYDLKSRLADSTSVEREEYHSGLSYAGSGGTMSIRLAAGSERRDYGRGLGDYASTLEGRLDFQVNRGRRFSLVGGVSQRRLDYDATVARGDERFTTGDLRLNLRDIWTVTSLSASYRLANTLSSVYETKLIEVEQGGDYDSLGNYVPGVGGYAISRYETGRKPVTRVKANLGVELGRKSKVLLDRSLSSRTGIDIQGESSSGDRRVAFMDPAFILSDDGVAYGNIEISQDVIFRRKSGLTLSLDARASKMLDNRCSGRRETKRVRQIQMRIARPMPRGVDVTLDGRMTATESETVTASWKTSPERLVRAARVNLQRDVINHIRGAVRIEYLDEDRTQPDMGYAQMTFSPSLTVLANAVRCDAGVDLKRIVSTRLPSSGVSPWNDSLNWHSRLNVRHGRYTSVSLEYVGRSGNGLQTTHNLRASVSAAF